MLIKDNEYFLDKENNKNKQQLMQLKYVFIIKQNIRYYKIKYQYSNRKIKN